MSLPDEGKKIAAAIMKLYMTRAFRLKIHLKIVKQNIKYEYAK